MTSRAGEPRSDDAVRVHDDAYRWRLVVEVVGPREWFGADAAAPTIDAAVKTVEAWAGEGARCERVELGRVD